MTWGLYAPCSSSQGPHPHRATSRGSTGGYANTISMYIYQSHYIYMQSHHTNTNHHTRCIYHAIEVYILYLPQ